MYKGRTAGIDNMLSLGAAVSRETAIVTDTEKYPSRTIQSAKDDADINVIVKRFGITGQMPASPRLPSYGDYSGVIDYQSAMNVIVQAKEAFMELPAEIRAKFGNDPQAYLQFASDPENIDSMRKMGLAIPKKDDIITPPADVPPKLEKGNARNPGKRAGKASEASSESDGDGD